MKRALITGAGGFIGSHLVEVLVRSGYDIRAFVFYNSTSSTGWLENMPDELKDQFEIIFGDIRDPYFMKKALKGCHMVFHLAALVGIPYSHHAPETYVDTNIKGTLNILQAARELDLQKVVHTSTSEVYGTACFVPITEEHPLQGQSPYSATKIGADQLALSFYRSFETPVSIIRPFNTYGPRQSLRAVIPTVIEQMVKGSTRLKLGAIHPTRDFTYIRDTVHGFRSIAESDRSIGQVINIGSSYEISIGGLVQLISEILGVEIEVETEAARLRPKESEVERLWADHTKASQLLNWEPHYTGQDGLKKGLQETIAWFKHEANLKGYKQNTFHL